MREINKLQRQDASTVTNLIDLLTSTIWKYQQRDGKHCKRTQEIEFKRDGTYIRYAGKLRKSSRKDNWELEGDRAVILFNKGHRASWSAAIVTVSRIELKLKECYPGPSCLPQCIEATLVPSAG